MGEVYRARDSKLGRDVAIKTLPAALASDKDRLARFEREAKLLAGLNHPHIASVYSLDEHEGTLYLAMELVEGPTLEETLKRGALPVEDALRLALQIAEALEAAHSKGVIHRDLKPANVMVTNDGIVKVLDFGLAKAFSRDPSESDLAQSPALSVAMTQQGLVLGTAGYMSPEQASGQPTDQRADIWSFGVVLYEMLTGLPLFSGESVPHILADVLKSEPDWTRLPKHLHPRLSQVLERCLRKKPRVRYQAIGDVRIDIEEILNDPHGVTGRVAATGGVSQRAVWSKVAASVVLSLALAGTVAWIAWPRGEPPAVNRFVHTLPEGQAFRAPELGVFALAPNGRDFIYNTLNGLYRRSLDTLEARVIPGTEGGANAPIFSPDSQSIAFTRQRGINRIAINGGASVHISDASPGVPIGTSWADDGTIFFSRDAGILRVPGNGGATELVVEVTGDEFLSSPSLLPDGDSLLFVVTHSTDWDTGQIVVQSLASGERRVLVNGGSAPRFVRTGHIVYAFEDRLLGIAFNPGTLSVAGGSVPLVQGVLRAALSPDANYGIADNGTLAYVSGGVGGSRNLTLSDRTGQQKLLLTSPGNYEQPRFSPDGTRVAYSTSDGSRNTDVFTYDLARGIPTRLTFAAGIDSYPVWTPDGERIAFYSDRDGGGLFWQAANGTGQAELLAPVSGTEELIPTAFLPDGSALLYYTQGGGAPSDLYLLSMDGDRTARLLVGTEFDEDFSDISPDGRWIAYSSDESGTDQVYVRPLPNVDDGKWQVSTDFGIDPVWSRAGKQLIYRTREAFMVAGYDDEPTFSPQLPEVLFETRIATLTGRSSFDVSPDGQQIVRYQEASSASLRQIVIVENWVEELKRLVPTD